MPGEMVPERRELRASHEERDQAVERLTVAAGEGRLTPDELDERLEAALTARTHGELAALLADLPDAGPVWAAGVAAAAPEDVSRIAVDGASTKRDGSWVVPRRLEVESRSGSVVLDFTQAVTAAPTLEIEVAVRSGSVTLLVPPDVVADDVAVRDGSVRHQARPEPVAPVRMRIRMTGEVHGGSIAIRPPGPPRRGFWQWLLRRPRQVAALSRPPGPRETSG
ncbi:DUF1707 domain-containing protein [Streptomyces sp. NPDC056002]|uniref:DUF1707 SHOCT-like domain-containing protein n=1 Tax=Streptomyces sp. NPDC056002 TaxID=3345675 RepID=UPI0035D9EAD7